MLTQPGVRRRPAASPRPSAASSASRARRGSERRAATGARRTGRPGRAPTRSPPARQPAGSSGGSPDRLVLDQDDQLVLRPDVAVHRVGLTPSWAAIFCNEIASNPCRVTELDPGVDDLLDRQRRLRPAPLNGLDAPGQGQPRRRQLSVMSPSSRTATGQGVLAPPRNRGLGTLQRNCSTPTLFPSAPALTPRTP